MRIEGRKRRRRRNSASGGSSKRSHCSRMFDFSCMCGCLHRLLHLIGSLLRHGRDAQQARAAKNHKATRETNQWRKGRAERGRESAAEKGTGENWLMESSVSV